jgi:hypothetical protein
MPDGYKIMPHWHSQDDTVKAPAHNLEVGTFHFLPAKNHAAERRPQRSELSAGGRVFR